MPDKEILQKVQLVEGQFSPSHAAQVITSLIDEKINFHKLNKLTAWMGDNECNTDYVDGRIVELEREKKVAQDLIKTAMDKGLNIQIDGTLELTFVPQEEAEDCTPLNAG